MYAGMWGTYRHLGLWLLFPSNPFPPDTKCEALVYVYTTSRNLVIMRCIWTSRSCFHQIPSSPGHKMKCEALVHVYTMWRCIDLVVNEKHGSVYRCIAMFLYLVQDVGMTVTPATSFDMEKVRTTIKQFFRDWSEEGAAERDLCYKPVIDEIISRYPPDKM